MYVAGSAAPAADWSKLHIQFHILQASLQYCMSPELSVATTAIIMHVIAAADMHSHRHDFALVIRIQNYWAYRMHNKVRTTGEQPEQPRTVSK